MSKRGRDFENLSTRQKQRRVDAMLGDFDDFEDETEEMDSNYPSTQLQVNDGLDQVVENEIMEEPIINFCSNEELPLNVEPDGDEDLDLSDSTDHYFDDDLDDIESLGSLEGDLDDPSLNSSDEDEDEEAKDKRSLRKSLASWAVTSRTARTYPCCIRFEPTSL